MKEGADGRTLASMHHRHHSLMQLYNPPLCFPEVSRPIILSPMPPLSSSISRTPKSSTHQTKAYFSSPHRISHGPFRSPRLLPGSASAFRDGILSEVLCGIARAW